MRVMSATGERATRACRHSISLVMRRVAGFTLLEVMVVIAILAMIAAAFPIALNRALPARRVSVALAHVRAEVRDCETTSRLTGKRISAGLERLTGRLGSTTHASMTDAQGAVVSALVLYADGSTSGARIDIVDGSHRGSLWVSEITGRVSVQRNDLHGS
jgi:prepilin-type N-terminal cleavage/methylation domain-containing protein